MQLLQAVDIFCLSLAVSFLKFDGGKKLNDIKIPKFLVTLLQLKNRQQYLGSTIVFCGRIFFFFIYNSKVSLYKILLDQCYIITFFCCLFIFLSVFLIVSNNDFFFLLSINAICSIKTHKILLVFCALYYIIIIN